MLAPLPVKDVQRKLTAAADDQVAKVLALVDAMPARGVADALIAPLRPRLAAIAPARPMTATRLLFRPLDHVVVAGVRWRPSMPAVPRTALQTLGSAVLARMGPVLALVQAMIAGHDGREQAVARQAGALLWPAGAAALLALPMPPDWTDATGLAEACYPALRDSIAVVLRHGTAIGRLTLGSADAVPVVRAILGTTAAEFPGALGTMLSVLLADAATAGPALAVAVTMPGPAVDGAVDQALDRALNVFTGVLPVIGLHAASVQAAHAAALLEALDSPQARPQLRSETLRLRQSADSACRDRLMQALDVDFLPRLASAGTNGSDAEILGLETAARGVRRLSMVGRRFGSGPIYDRILGHAANGTCAAANSVLTRMERLRVAELLVGVDAALRLLPA